MEKGQYALQAMAEREELATMLLNQVRVQREVVHVDGETVMESRQVIEELLIKAGRPEICDSLTTIKALLTTHKQLAAEYLAKNHEVFFKRMMDVIHCGVYVTQRQFLRLLSDLLLDKTDFQVFFIFDKILRYFLNSLCLFSGI